MKNLSVIMFTILISLPTFAANKAQGKLPRNAKLGTSFRFEGSSLRGKYQSSMNANTTVENDKLIQDLLRGRTEFEDRRKQEMDRN